VRIAKQVGAGSGEHQHADSAKTGYGQGQAQFWARTQHLPQQPGDDDQQQETGFSSKGSSRDRDRGRKTGETYSAFFGGQMPDRRAETTARCMNRSGSGFIVDPKGYIINNYHVIEKADKIYVKLSTDPDNQDLGRPRA